MANNEKTPNQARPNANETAEVLYQKLGNRWYAFSVIDDEVFMGSISQEEINVLSETSPKISANS
jgi:hypothetical protein